MASPFPQLSPEEFVRDRSTPAILADWIPRIIGIICVFIRIYARKTSGQRLWWDDWLVMWTAAYCIPLMITEGVLKWHFGLGRHLQWVLANMPQPRTIQVFAKLVYWDQLGYPIIIGPIKASILCLYIRLFGTNRKLWWACIAQIVVVVIWSLVTFFLFAFQCDPVSGAWSPVRADAKCFTYPALFLGTNIVNVIMDFGILITPLPLIWRLNLDLKKKFLLTGVFLFGTCTATFATVRLAILSQLTFVDATWDAADAVMWSTSESGVGLICACIPTFGPLFSRYRTDTQAAATPPYATKARMLGTFGSGGRTPKRQSGWVEMDTQTGGESVQSLYHHEMKSTVRSSDTSIPKPTDGIRQTVDIEVQSQHV